MDSSVGEIPMGFNIAFHIRDMELLFILGGQWLVVGWFG